MRHQALSPIEAEAALDGDLHGHAGLRALLEAARGPVQLHELHGLAAATAAFGTAPADGRESGRSARTLASRLAASALAVKIMLACLGAAALGDITYAGVNGNLPGTTHHSPAAPNHTSTSVQVAPPTAVPPGHAVGTRPGTGSTVAPDAALQGLCTSWLASAHDPNRASDHRFTKLVNAAGNASAVTSYCSALSNPAKNANAEHPSSTAHPTPRSQPHPSNFASITPPKPAHTKPTPSGR